MTGSHLCPLCLCPIQRTEAGTVDDGMRAHFTYVHPDQPLHPTIRSTET